METGLNVIAGSSTQIEGADQPEINWSQAFPQIFTRKGEIRRPGKWLNSKPSFADMLKRVTAIRNLQKVACDTCELRVVTKEGGVWMNAQTTKEFMAKDRFGLEDLIAAGWYVSYA